MDQKRIQKLPVDEIFAVVEAKQQDPKRTWRRPQWRARNVRTHC
jgi:hypothetical protein